MTDGKSLGKSWRERLAERMATLGLSQTRVAEEMNLNQSTINHWLSGRREPSLCTLEQLSAVLKMTPAELITGVSREKAQIVESMTVEELRVAYNLMLMKRQQSQDGDSRRGGKNEPCQRVS